ncbi:hypothetical protein [Brevundimonas sp. TWP2-3-4b2]|uniref:hypothetical protein n=1 Tax=Brevundimonas sp. TWP2-3-4b2 TaxID=2804595 RepID=UPI003CEC3144
MTHAPRIAEEQRSEADHGGKSGGPGACSDGHDPEPGPQTCQPGDLNPDGRDRFGDLRQNRTNRWMVQER